MISWLIHPYKSRLVSFICFSDTRQMSWMGAEEFSWVHIEGSSCLIFCFGVQRTDSASVCETQTVSQWQYAYIETEIRKDAAYSVGFKSSLCICIFPRCSLLPRISLCQAHSFCSDVQALNYPNFHTALPFYSSSVPALRVYKNCIDELDFKIICHG